MVASSGNKRETSESHSLGKATQGRDISSSQLFLTAPGTFPQRRLSYHVWKGNCILVHPQATTSAREEGPMDSEALEPDCPSSPFSFLNCQRLLPTHPQAQLGSLPCLTPDVLELTFCESVDCQGGSCSSAQNLKIQKSSNICNALSCITFLSSHQNSVSQPGKRINIQF